MTDSSAGQRVVAGRTVVVHLVADEGMPSVLAEWLTESLPSALAARVHGGVRWQVCSATTVLRINEDGDIPIVEIAEAHRDGRRRELVVLLTDLPRRAGTHPVASDFSTSGDAALVSVPALGAIRLRHRARSLVAHLVAHLLENDPRPDPETRRHSAQERMTGKLGDLLAPTVHISSKHEGVDMHLGLVGVRGRLRLLAGMVRDNRPWRLVPNLASATAAAAGTAAYGLITSSFWHMADFLSPPRLALISLAALAAMTAWLVAYNHLGDRPSDVGEREKAVLYNLSTLLTVLIGVAIMYALLFGVTLLAAATLIDSAYFGRELRHPVSIVDYVRLVWLTSSVGIVAGALGSSLESEDSVRRATYSAREAERRARAREREERRESSPR
ncbi:hypothetical protein ACFQ34_05725 [Pseudonocardia benzenivorans]|uniref:DUF2267 domain-containing protein n=1 Tax=Pseudonocardia benzenivorans TaxID=228005 RepID=A0ABW3VD99_9PSEU